MNNSEKHEFIAVMKTTADMYGKPIPNTRIAVYWEALKYRKLFDVKTAINLHIQDVDRGRFFPLPADIAAQLPAEHRSWLTADEAWATCPKDEKSSAAMCDEIAAALDVATALIVMGDMVAARRAFIDHYNTLADDGKREGRKPVWWKSYGHDKSGRFKADIQITQRQNLALPASEKKPIPLEDLSEPVKLQKLIETAAVKNDIDPQEQIKKLRKIVGK